MAAWPSTLLHIDSIARDTIAAHFRKPDAFEFEPGQTVSLSLPPPDGQDTKPLRHTFSLVSAPHEDHLSIATRVRSSPFKQALTRLPPNAPLNFSGPYGKFTLPDDPARPVVLIAGGIGITPFISMLRSAAHRRATREFRLLYANRQLEDAAFLAELQALTQSNTHFRLMATLTGRPLDSWQGLQGRFNQTMLNQAFDGLRHPLCYLTGTPEMVAAIEALLTEAGLAEDAIHSEGFHGY